MGPSHFQSLFAAYRPLIVVPLRLVVPLSEVPPVRLAIVPLRLVFELPPVSPLTSCPTDIEALGSTDPAKYLRNQPNSLSLICPILILFQP